MTFLKKRDIIATTNARTERSNTGFRSQRARGGVSRASEPVRITLPSSDPKGCLYYRAAVLRERWFQGDGGSKGALVPRERWFPCGTAVSMWDGWFKWDGGFHAGRRFPCGTVSFAVTGCLDISGISVGETCSARYSGPKVIAFAIIQVAPRVLRSRPV